MTDSAKIRVLLIEDNPTDALIVKSELEGDSDARFSVVHVEQLKEALSILEVEHFDVALLDLSLPDSQGFETFTRLYYAVPEMPVVVLSGRVDEELAIKAVHTGAQDYLVKGQTSDNVLPRSIQYAIERQRSQKDLRVTHAQLALTNEKLLDEIAGHMLAEQAMRESEGKLRQIAENINEVIWLKNSQEEGGGVLYISPGYERVWGQSSKDFYDSPSPWGNSIHPDDYERMLATPEPHAFETCEEQYRIVRPDRAERWIRSRAFPVKEDDGAVHRVVFVAEDITEHKLMEVQFRQAQKMEAMGMLAGCIAHDFSNLLGAIQDNVSWVMVDFNQNHPAWNSLTEIKKASERATDLVQQILSFGKRNQQERRVISLAPVIEEAVILLRSTLHAGVELANPVAKNVADIIGDSTQIHQVLLSLCANALHALEGKPGRIEVRLDNITLDVDQTVELNGIRPGPYVCLSVSDTGKGMDELTLKRIFEPFFTTKPIDQGTGLGLSNVYNIVQNHEGAIKVVSQPGQGATFSLYFPQAREAPDVHARRSTTNTLWSRRTHSLFG